MPEAQWLEFSQWVYSTLEAKINEWTTGVAAVAEMTAEARGGCASTRCAPELAWTQAWWQRWSTLEEFARCCRLPVPGTVDMMAKLVASGAFVRRETGGSVRFGYKPDGFLVYGPRLAGRIDAIWEDVYQEDVMTPFAVEFRRALNSKQAGTPMLVPVAGGQGISVRARVLILNYRSGRPLNCSFHTTANRHSPMFRMKTPSKTARRRYAWKRRRNSVAQPPCTMSCILPT